jgi:hypothetical protein
MIDNAYIAFIKEYGGLDWFVKRIEALSQCTDHGWKLSTMRDLRSIIFYGATATPRGFFPTVMVVIGAAVVALNNITVPGPVTGAVTRFVT